LLVLAAAAAAGCRSTSYYMHPRADLGTIQKVGVMPFETMTAERAPADKVQKIFLAELLATGAFEVVEPGVVLKALKDEKVENIGALTPADIVKLAKAMGANGLFFGTVVDYGDARGGAGTATEITIQLRLVDGQSGSTVWSASRTRSGATVSARLFGFGGESSSEVARDLVRDELSTLLR
ncbi:MAG TPA: GNA1162 family protein, partial [Anaeromyxobacter sp.]